MPLFKDYSENAELLQIRRELLNAENLPRYIKVDGEGRAVGYIEGLEDITTQMEETCFHRLISGRYFSNDSYKIGRAVKSFHEEKCDFIRLAKEFLANPDLENANPINQEVNDTRILTNTPPFHATDFVKYVKENGTEKAKGYIECYADITNQVAMYFDKVIGTITTKNSPNNIGTATKNLYEERMRFLAFAKKEITSPGMTIKPIEDQKLRPLG